MPRRIEEILEHADELAERFESYEPRPADEVGLRRRHEPSGVPAELPERSAD